MFRSKCNRALHIYHWWGDNRQRGCSFHAWGRQNVASTRQTGRCITRLDVMLGWLNIKCDPTAWDLRLQWTMIRPPAIFRSFIWSCHWELYSTIFLQAVFDFCPQRAASLVLQSIHLALHTDTNCRFCPPTSTILLRLPSLSDTLLMYGADGAPLFQTDVLCEGHYGVIQELWQL